MDEIKMNAELYQAELKKLYMLASVLEAVPLEEMAQIIERADSFGPFVDPTLWMQKGQALREDGAVVVAFRDAMRAISKLKVDVERRASQR